MGPIARRRAALLAGALLAGLSGVGTAPRPSTHGWTTRAVEVIRTVRANFYDRRAAETWAARNSDYAARARSDAEFAAVTKAALAQLKTSHTAYYTVNDPEYPAIAAIYGANPKGADSRSVSTGADIDSDGFVRVVFAGGPAARTGLRRGDRILRADGRPFDRVASFRRGDGAPVLLDVERSPGGPPIQIAVRPRRIAPKQEWLEAQRVGARLIARNGRTAAYVPMFSCAGEEFEAGLAELLSTRLSAADSLILDFRDGWGGCNPDFVNLFSAAPAVLTVTGQDGKARQIDSQWRKPLIVLINGGSRSGKEVVAYSIKKHRLGVLVGARTAGAVVAGRCFRLSDSSLLLLAVADVLVDGERLEGRGVEPDVAVSDDLRSANGADPQLEKAIELATRR